MVFAVLFAASVLLQYNDPDPVPWMLLYGAACVACITRVSRGVLLAIAGPALAWAVWIAAHTTLAVPLTEALGDWGMHAGGSEEAREVGGLLLVTLWMGVRSRRPTAGPILPG